jgi:gamma-glutamylcyclotransferase (GGCT)/AIG2-like uncharacterized protein YtfP
MLIYNVTININEAVHDEWLGWMKQKHIPDMLSTGKFLEATMSKVLIDEEMGGITYSVQYKVKDRDTLNAYYSENAPTLRDESLKHFGDNFVAFRTELEVLTIENAVIPSATEYLFTYGTLQDEAVQNVVFSRTLKGNRDLLTYHKVAKEKVGGLYPTLRPSTKEEDQVRGEVFIVSSEELIRADSYEGDAYYRKKVTLASGTQAWVYIGKSAFEDPNQDDV